MFHKIKEVKPKEDLIIEVQFENNEIKQYDIKKIINKWYVFEKLKDKKLFENVKVDVGGYGIILNEDIDLSCEEIWENGEKIHYNLMKKK